MIAIIWRFRPADGAAEQFEAAYRSDGDWARLFRQGSGFVRTELLRGLDGAYLTIDMWRSAADWDRFRAQHRAAYEALDRSCERLTASEEKIGVFDVV